MADFTMPSLGADMEDGTLIEWKVRPGAVVHRGDILAVIETQKGAIDVEVFHDGVVTELRVPEGAKVPVGTVLAVLDGAGGAPSPAPAPPPVAPKPTPSAAPLPAAQPAPAGQVRASPSARRRAQELHVDLREVRGTGPHGAIQRVDVERHQPSVPPAAPAPSTAPMRQAIAAAMSRSKREIPHYYLSQPIELKRALDWLAEANRARPIAQRLLPGVLLVRAVALALRKFPELNGTWVDGAFRPGAGIHPGIAISLRAGGLVIPALHDADRADPAALMAQMADVVERSRAGRLRASDLADGTITITNLGDLGVESVLGVIYPPQVAIVGFGRIAERPWAVDGMLTVRPVVTATLAGDHRASDGHRGGQFLAAVDRLLQAPEAL